MCCQSPPLKSAHGSALTIDTKAVIRLLVYMSSLVCPDAPRCMLFLRQDFQPTELSCASSTPSFCSVWVGFPSLQLVTALHISTPMSRLPSLMRYWMNPHCGSPGAKPKWGTRELRLHHAFDVIEVWGYERDRGQTGNLNEGQNDNDRMMLAKDYCRVLQKGDKESCWRVISSKTITLWV